MTKLLHRFGRGVAVVLALAVGLGVAGYVVATRPDLAYAHVASIRQAAIFQNAAELDRAWSPLEGRLSPAGYLSATHAPLPRDIV